MKKDLIDVENATHQELLQEYDEVTGSFWSSYSCDSLGFYIDALHKQITKLGGWPTK